MPGEIYRNGSYLKNNPTWHAEDAPWKTKQIIKMLERNALSPKTICEVGCGAGEILAELQRKMDKECAFWGYEISPQAFEICRKKENDKLHFKLADILKEKEGVFDLLLLIDVLEHMEDYFNFLREIKSKSVYKILHIPLDVSVQALLRGKRILKGQKSVGHIHYFTKETAIAALKDTGYEVLDHFYTGSLIELPVKSWKSYLAKMPRKILFAINKDFAVRLMGGWSLMVLAK